MKFQFITNKKPSIRFFNNPRDFDACKFKHKFLLNKSSHGYLDTLDSFSMIKSIISNGTDNIICDMTHLTLSQKASFAFMSSKYFFSLSTYKTDLKDKTDYVLSFLDLPTTQKFWDSICFKIKSANIAMVLASEPSNVVYPDEFCKRVVNLFKGNTRVNIKVYDEKQIEKMGLGLIAGVGKGSEKKPRFLIIDMNSNEEFKKTICLCGKGVCFDSGGYDLKKDMRQMHGDKSGGALVVGLLHYFAFKAYKTKNRIVGIIPLVENLINGQAAKTSDILTAYDKQTIEILDTDAEGRQILADSLAYACKNFKPDIIMDFATLTSWSDMHCDTSYIFYSNNDKLGALVNKIGTSIGERNIKMPNWPEYIRYTKSTVADLKNSGYKCKNGNTGGTVEGRVK